MITRRKSKNMEKDLEKVSKPKNLYLHSPPPAPPSLMYTFF